MGRGGERLGTDIRAGILVGFLLAGVLLAPSVPLSTGTFASVLALQSTRAISSFPFVLPPESMVVGATAPDAPMDVTPPMTTATLSGPSGANGWYLGPVTVTLSASDPSGVASTFYQVDGGGWQTYGGPFNVAGDGSHTVLFYSVDVPGNREQTKSVTFGIDTVAPAVTLTLDGTPGNSGWFVSDVLVSLVASDATSGVSTIQYKINLDPWAVYSRPLVLADGVYTFSYYAVDVAGLTSPTHVASIQVDEHAPVSTVSFTGSFGNGTWYNSPVTVTVTSTDWPSGVASVSYRVDGDPWQNYAGPFTIGTEGTHLVEVFATDVAGNVEPTQVHAVGVDATAPTTSLSLQGQTGSNGWYRSGVQVTLNASDGGSGVAVTLYRLDRNPWQSYPGPFMVWDGIHNLQYASRDVAGNVESTSNVTIRVDASPPISSAALGGSPGAGGWWGSSVLVVLSGVDATSGLSGVFYRTDGGSWQTYTGGFTVSGEGRHLVEHFATDLAGNSEDIQSTAVNIDTTPPLSTVSLNGTAGSSGWYRSNVTVELGAQDQTSGVRALSFRLDGGPWQDYSSPFIVRDGRHILEYQAIDFAGNTESLNSTPFKVDATPPAFLDMSPGGIIQSSALVIGWNASDATSGIDRYEISIDGEAVIVLGSATHFALSLPDGTHDVRVRAVDGAGNVATNIITVRVDTNVFSLTGPSNGTPTYLILLAGTLVLLFLTWRLGNGGRERERPPE